MLCPTGVGFSTISDEEFEILEASASDGYPIEEIDASVYQEWLANAKELESIFETTYKPTTDYFTDVYSSETFQQGVMGLDGTVELNNSPHPIPLMYYESNSLRFDRGAGNSNYYRSDGGTQFPVDLPYLFIRNGKFYWFRTSNNNPNRSLTLTDTELKFSESYKREVLDPVGLTDFITVTETFTNTTRITERFY